MKPPEVWHVKTIWPHVRPIVGRILLIGNPAKLRNGIVWPSNQVDTVISELFVSYRLILGLMRSPEELEELVEGARPGLGTVAMFMPLSRLAHADFHTFSKTHPYDLYLLKLASGKEDMAWFTWNQHTKGQIHFPETRI